MIGQTSAKHCVCGWPILRSSIALRAGQHLSLELKGEREFGSWCVLLCYVFVPSCVHTAAHAVTRSITVGSDSLTYKPQQLVMAVTICLTLNSRGIYEQVVVDDGHS